MTEPFTERFAAGLTGYGDGQCIEYGGRWYSGNDVTAYVDAIASLLREAGVADDAPVGLVVRNRLPHAAAIMGFIAAGRTVSMIYSFQSADAVGRDIEKLNLAAIVADEDDWTDEVIAAAKRAGSAGLALSMRAPTVATVAGLEHRDAKRRHTEPEPGVALQILTSGTTGPPKRQSIKTQVLERTVFSVTSGEAAPPGAPPEFSYWQFGGIGVCQLIAGAYNGRRIVILERFSVDSWVNAVKTHGIKRSGVQPAVIRMLLDADVPREDLASPVKYAIHVDAVTVPIGRNTVPRPFDGGAEIIGDGSHNACENAINVDAGTIHARDGAAAIVRHGDGKGVQGRISTGNPGPTLNGAGVNDLRAGICPGIDAIVAIRASVDLIGGRVNQAGVSHLAIHAGTHRIVSRRRNRSRGKIGDDGGARGDGTQIERLLSARGTDCAVIINGHAVARNVRLKRVISAACDQGGAVIAGPIV